MNDQSRPLTHGMLYSPNQLPEIEGDEIILTWDQDEADSLILYEEKVIWRGWTGWEVYERFAEIALILKHKYGPRLKDLVPTPGSEYALYGDSTGAVFHVRDTRESFARELQVEKYYVFNLQEAIVKGDGATIRHYLAQGGDPNVQDRGGYSPLHFAARQLQADIVRALLASGADPNMLDNNGLSPLCYALREYRTMKSLGFTPYAFVVFTGFYPVNENDRCIELVNLLLDAGAHISGLNEPFNELRGWALEMYSSPLALAAGNGQNAIVRILLERGAEVDSVDWSGATPLMDALISGHVDTARILLAAGANVEQTYNDRNDTVLIVAIRMDIDEQKIIEMVHDLLQAGADINRANAEDESPLFTAIFHLRLRVVKFLIQHGADVHHRDREGNGALGFFVWTVAGSYRWIGNRPPLSKMIPWIEALRDAGADVNMRNHEGRTPRDLARHYKATKLAEFLDEL